jgi:UDP-glucose 4-epimerase
VSNLCAALDAARTHQRAAGETFFVSDGEECLDTGTRPRDRRCAQCAAAAVDAAPGLLMLVATLAGRRDAARRLLESFAIDSARIRRTLQWSPPLALAEELERLAADLRRQGS